MFSSYYVDIDQSLRYAIIEEIRASPSYIDNVYTAEMLCKLANELRINANVVTMMNHCPTHEGISAGCGGMCPPSLNLHDCASMKVFHALAHCLNSSL